MFDEHPHGRRVRGAIRIATAILCLFSAYKQYVKYENSQTYDKFYYFRINYYFYDIRSSQTNFELIRTPLT